MHAIGREGIATGVEPAHRNGQAATHRKSLAHDVSIVLGVGRHLGSQSRANTSMTIMRAPQRGHAATGTDQENSVHPFLQIKAISQFSAVLAH
jgi:hypothetical protein